MSWNPGVLILEAPGIVSWADLEDPVLAREVPEGWTLPRGVECRSSSSHTSPTMIPRDLVRDLVDCPTLANQSLCEHHPAAMLNECR